MKQIAIYGAGGLGREVLLLIQQINQAMPTWDILGFFDDGVAPGTDINGVSVLGGIDALNQHFDPIHVVIAIAKPSVKQAVVAGIRNPLVQFPVLIHPSVTLADFQFIQIGPGTVIGADVRLTVNITIGQHVLLDRRVMVGHDTQIGDFSSLTPGVIVSGAVVLDAGVFVGTGATISNQVTIGQNATVGAGAVVVDNLPGFCTAVGIPARPILFNLPTNG